MNTEEALQGSGQAGTATAMIKETILQGKSASGGMGLGRAVLLPGLSGFVPHRDVPEKDRQAEEGRFERALQKSAEQMNQIIHRAELAEEYRLIFEAQLLFFEDPLIVDDVCVRIRAGANAEGAVVDSLESFKKKLSVLDNQLIRERASDLADVENRILSNLMEVPEGDIRIPMLRSLPADAVLVADDISPSLMLHVRRAAGIAVERGGVTGHMAILARSRGIPVVVGVEDLLSVAQAGGLVLVDAQAGRVIFSPNAATRERHGKYRASAEKAEDEPIVGFHDLSDSSRAELWVNIDEPVDVSDPRVRAAAGVGLFRTEFLYLNQPGLFFMQEEQQAIYEDILRRAAGRPVTLRMLDIGDDKLVGSSFYNVVNLHGESLRNLRGIHFLLANPRLLRSQLQAMFHAIGEVAPPAGSCRLLLPMVTGIEQVEAFREHMVAAANEVGLLLQGVPVGVMLETPAACLMSDVLALHCDFFSIGTNDLSACLFAIDRVQSLGQENSLYQPALYRMIADVQRVSTVPLSVCGETAAVPGLLLILVGIGLRQFSIARSALPRASGILARIDLRVAAELSARALAAPGEAAFRRIVREAERAALP